MNHLPVLQVIVPLLAAPICLLLRHGGLARVLATCVAWSSFAMALISLDQVAQLGTLTYYLGGWEPPWGIEYRIDRTSALVLVVVTGIASAVIPIGPGEKSYQIPGHRHAMYYAAFLLCLCGLLGMTVTADAFNVFVFLEISSLSTYTLIGLGSNRRALTAAFNYLIMGTVGGTFYLIGVGLLYQMTGSLNMADIATRLSEMQSTRTVVVAFAFVTMGLAVKLAVFPVHQWLPNAYAYSPSAVSAFLAGTGTKVVYYLLARILMTVFGAAFVFDILGFDRLLMPISLVAMFAGSVAAIYQTDLKRLLAYSSIAQVGYLTLALSLGTTEGIAAGLLHMFNHALMKGGLFLVVACIVCRTGSSQISELGGLARRMPMTFAALIVGGFGLIGVPSTVGFISKWYLVSAALGSGSYVVAALILASSLLAVVYVWKIVEACVFGKAPEGAPQEEAPLGMLIPTWALLGATLVFGLSADFTTHAATSAAEQLSNGVKTAKLISRERRQLHAHTLAEPNAVTPAQESGQ